MLELPDHGFQRSVKEQNVKMETLTDWIEASVLFIDGELSVNDVVDVLCENNIYDEQDFAKVRVGDAWLELGRRHKLMGKGATFRVAGRRLTRLAEWHECPAYSFCVLLTVQVLFKPWARQFGPDYTVQGALFEQVTAECLESLGWDVLSTGWTPGQAVQIKEVVQNVSQHLSEAEVPDAIEDWLSENANEEKLDVVCADPFSDGWGGRPLFFFQCASGGDWPTKLSTPEPDVWRKIIKFTTVPQRGFSMPFALLEKEFRRKAGRVNGMFLDRFRLQTPGCSEGPNWCSQELADSIIEWMRPRVAVIPDDGS